LFMAETKRKVPTGTAISRSRFEDNAFTLGDNLKDGVKTNGYGTVQVKVHTEFEIVFTDPATKELHIGVQETIRKGSNLDSWPGYPDYRHVLVGGQGILIHPPHSDEIWGLLCEGDIEEIFKYRSLNIKFFLSLGVLYAVPIILFNFMIKHIPNLFLLWNVLQWALISIVTLFLINLLALKPLKNTIKLLEEIAEGEGDLTKRVQFKKQDQMGELSRWFNKFVNNQMHIAQRIKNATKISKHSVEELGKLMSEVNESTAAIDTSLKEMLNTFEGYTYGLEGMQSDFNKINTTMEDINSTMETATGEMNSINKNALESRNVSMNAYKVMNEIVTEVGEATNSIRQLEEFSNQISGVIDIISSISTQTNLLSLNASIEAARAGEYGKGFAVVAGEIHKLAGMTLDSSKKISDQIQNIQDEIKHNAKNIRHIGDKVKLGSSSVNQTIDSFSVIQKDIDNITNSFGSISGRLADNTTIIENILETQKAFISNFEEASTSTKVSCNQMIKTLEVNNQNMQQVKDTLEYTTTNMFNMVNEFRLE
jgi:methyl-accepting chemotaxis protein